MKSRKRRIKELLARDENLKKAHPLFLHIIPEDQNIFLPLTTEEDKTFLSKNFSPIPEGGRSTMYNFEGFRIYSHTADLKPYVQIFRNGAVEYFTNNLVTKNYDGSISFSGEYLSKEMVRISRELSVFLNHYNLPFNFKLYLTILNIKDIPIKGGSIYFPDHRNEISDLYFPKLTIDSIDDINKKFSQLLDMFWQAGGYSQNPYINKYKFE
jgi:hypothetical protein